MQVQDHIMLYGYKCKNMLGNKAFLHIFLSIMNKSYVIMNQEKIFYIYSTLNSFLFLHLSQPSKYSKFWK